ncbi:hypothetical protein [Pseudofrankia inefficax]|uniref:Uncharacterized protein n=1 Tax=Pseudofrankia inefficax (strain DSM 45817 / CECT 9037 / DDB 130130 / EuI1c) TaxID=298654 RepID=E3ITW8_PSEI1|nr:hypothetical protein [Pseudofrankia inefficax]ADP80015.1 hypothetical protein FraEuI1c_1965 [Pseudofrankia inefficax]
MTEAAWETVAWVAGTVALVALLAVPLACWLMLHGPVIAARLSAAISATRQGDAAAHLGDQDDLVQTLVVATYALQLGDQDRARAAVDGALHQSRAILDRMLAEAGHDALSRRDTAGHPSPRADAAPPASGTTSAAGRLHHLGLGLGLGRRGPLRRERPAAAPGPRIGRHVA